MSASLVGSEMCIRDSADVGHGDDGVSMSGRPSSQTTTRRPSTRNCAAVSYTHLTLPTICSV
eukprot:2858522-Alexandrium_andersonii.AAC.1